MSAVYVVVVTNDKAEVEAVETYAGVQSALGRAVRLASQKTNNITLIDTSPQEERLEDGSLRWTFLDTNRYFVAVYFKHIEVTVPSHNSRLDAITDPNVLQYNWKSDPLEMLDGYQPPSVPVLDGYQMSATILPPPPLVPAPLPTPSLDEDNLPAGWFFTGKPARMKDLKREPYNIRSPLDLSEDEQWALVIARTTKRLNALTSMNGFTFVMGAALADLKARTPAGLELVKKELDWLDDYRSELIDD